MGKGSKRRESQVDNNTWGSNFDAVFGKKPNPDATVATMTAAAVSTPQHLHGFAYSYEKVGFVCQGCGQFRKHLSDEV